MDKAQSLSSNSIIIFTDGASSGNPGPGGWGAILLLPTHNRQVLELGGGERNTTNNRMELTAIIRALDETPGKSEEIDIFTDSTYVIRGITQWIWGWKKKGWVSLEGKEVANQDLWKTLDRQVQVRKVSWHYVRGHSGIPGNERTDEIAVSFSQGKFPNLYEGPFNQYSVPILKIPSDTSLPEMKDPSKTKAKPYSYLSLVGQVAQRHSSWTECEARVKGQSGAKFKKAMSQQEEIQILESWGISPLKLKS
jgi:ribonuclease HI